MFKYTNFPDEPTQPSNPPKPRIRSTSNSNSVKCSERPSPGSRTGTPDSQKKDNTVSERYTNKMYNRIPSPKGRFQTLANAAKDRTPRTDVVTKKSPVEKERSKPSGRLGERTQPLQRPLPVKQSCSDVLSKKRPLDVDCNKSNNQVGVKPRPKTAQYTRIESRFENKVLNTVENVLSRALLQQGKIDETNIANIINSMRNSLNFDKSLDEEELSEIFIEPKPSRTTVNETNSVEENLAEKKIKPVFGIVRRDTFGITPEQKPYTKIYNDVESPSPTKNCTEDDETTFVCVDIPELVFPNFPSSKKTDGKTRLKLYSGTTASKKSEPMETTKTGGQQFEVGDFQTTENHFWNSSEDAKLRDYIESLIHNMKNQVNCDSVVTEGEIDSQGTICRSFCVCKVCVSKNTQSKTVLKRNPSRLEEPSVVNIEKPKPQVSTFQRSTIKEESTPIQRGPRNRLRSLKLSSKDTEANAQCKVIKNTNPNFERESSLNTSLKKRNSYIVVDTVNNPEETDDMYLQRRIRKAPSKKTSTKLK